MSEHLHWALPGPHGPGDWHEFAGTIDDNGIAMPGPHLARQQWAAAQAVIRLRGDQTPAETAARVRQLLADLDQQLADLERRRDQPRDEDS